MDSTLLKNARIIDGMGGEIGKANLLLRGGRIAEVIEDGHGEMRMRRGSHPSGCLWHGKQRRTKRMQR